MTFFFFNLFLLLTVRSRQVIRCLRYYDILRIPVLIMKKKRQRGSPLILGNCSWKKYQNMILSVDIGPNTILCSLWNLSNNSNQEALVRAIEPNASLQVEYDIVLSPTYQVPVLHFMLRWTNQKGPVVGIDSVYQYLVPDQYRKQLKSVGIMGGISFDVGARVLGSRPLHSSRFVVSSNIWCAVVFRPSLQYCRGYEAHCRGAECHTRDVSYHLARVGRALRWPAFTTWAFCNRRKERKNPRNPWIAELWCRQSSKTILSSLILLLPPPTSFQLTRKRT